MLVRGCIVLCLEDYDVGVRVARIALGGVELQTVLHLLDCAVVLPAHLKGAGEVVIGVGPPGSQLERLAQRGDGLVECGGGWQRRVAEGLHTRRLLYEIFTRGEVVEQNRARVQMDRAAFGPRATGLLRRAMGDVARAHHRAGVGGGGIECG